jgi:hypothetical protein
MALTNALVAVPVLTTSAAAPAATEACAAREIITDASRPSGTRPINASRHFCESHKIQAPIEIVSPGHPGRAAAAAT